MVLAGVAKRGGLPASQVALVGRLGPALALVGTTASVVSAALVSTGSLSHVTDVLSGQSGQLRAMALAVALIGVLVPPRLGEVQAPLAALAVFAEVASGHAAASIAPSVATVSASVHVGAVGVWLVARGRIGAAGPWSFRVTAASTRSPIEVAFAVELPTPDGTPVLRRALADLDRLRSVAMEEELRGSRDGPTITARYRFSAPAAFEFVVGDRSQIVIGDRSYERPRPEATWTAKAWPRRPFEWPGAYYRSVWARPAAVRVLGTEELEGQPMTVIAFVRPNLPAWIRLWVGVGAWCTASR